MNRIEDESIRDLLARVRSEGRTTLLETEAHALVRALGITVAPHFLAREASDVDEAALAALASERVVIKVVAAHILHKSDVGGVRVVPARLDAVRDELRAMAERFSGQEVAGYSINRFIPYDASLGGELLLGMRWCEDFGPVVTLGPGGIFAEFLCENLAEGRDVALLSPGLTPHERIEPILASKAIPHLISGGLRGQSPRIELAELRALLERAMAFAASAMPAAIAELEINPLVLSAEGPIALDALVKLGSPPALKPPERPLDKLARLFKPRSIAIIGVSTRPNPGHIILRNTLREGFSQERIFVVKPGCDQVLGCRCYPDISSLPEKVDLLILAVSAAQVPALIEESILNRKAESMVVIPGGLGEHSDSQHLVERMEKTLLEARAGADRGPVINGGNCLGIRSHPGRYDTLFIPEHKLPLPVGQQAPVAFISQSGAFGVAQLSRLRWYNPRYLVTTGNQMDLTVGDYLAHLAEDPEILVYACYVEGFRPLDGRKWLAAAAKIIASGRTVILYRAGRTPAGAGASASHTASIAGDYAVTRELAAGAGVVVANTLQDFEDLVRLFVNLRDKPVGGRRIGALSNAGFECVTMADRLRSFELAEFGSQTRARLRELFADARIEEIVEIHNPLDLTPMMNDERYEAAVRIMLEDPAVDLGVIGVVPLTAALNTLAPDPSHGEDFSRDDSIVNRLVRLARELPKPWVAVADSGGLYQPMVTYLESCGVPTFRSADRALRLLHIFCAHRLADS